MDASDAAESEAGIDLSQEDGTITTTKPILDTIHQQQLQAHKTVSTKQHLSGRENHASTLFIIRLL